MKQLFLFIFFILLLFSCKKEEQYNPDQHITYSHLYKLSGSADTLFSVYIPNAFTPNGDGINDVYMPKGYFDLTRLRIYNRLGEIVFETADKNKGWDGKINSSGYTVQEGNYTYRLMLKDTIGVDYEYLENLMLYK